MKLERLEDDLLYPDYTGNSIVNFSNTILKIYDEKPLHEPYKLPKKVIENLRKVIVLIVDALSYEAFSSTISDDDVQVFPASSVFPTTTAVALPSIYSGLTPLEHGFLGYILYLREVGSLVNMIEMTPPGFPRDSVLKSHEIHFITIFQRLQKNVQSFFLIPRYLLGSGFSRIMSQGAEQIGFSSFGDMIEKILELVNLKGKILIFAYWSSLDSIAHKSGVESAYFRELKWIYRILKSELVRKLKKDTVFFMLSDHGQITTSKEKEIWWDKNSEISKFFEKPPAGEQRMMYLYTRRKKSLVEYLMEKYSDFAFFLDPRESTALFGVGKRHPEFFYRVGDVILIAKKDFSFNYRYTGKEESLLGRHGSLSYQELVVPLIVYRRW
ncbi:alkaline phosphatase family protein [Thermotoga sp. KOL6]|uniref:alkaline phosphatase family protein n=1 Tax=Thermotoga sp. KOL6 TaxID=126741 RepID=UPI000C77C0E0|nr:alkaline phosphatase family protein [Thermotoga sp. KOL6]PLV60378.1 nucleotide pyrophosphatase [Thermotoga sp. KOL6]